VKGFGSSAILRVAIRQVRNEEFCDRTPKRGGGHVESCVASVKVVGDLSEKEVWRAVASRANLSAHSGKRGAGRQTAGHLVDVAIHDQSNEIEKDGPHWHG
jgi:hypothetical protein